MIKESNKLSTESAMSSKTTLQKLLRNYTFSNKQKLSRSITTIPALQEMQKEGIHNIENEKNARQWIEAV